MITPSHLRIAAITKLKSFSKAAMSFGRKVIGVITSFTIKLGMKYTKANNGALIHTVALPKMR